MSEKNTSQSENKEIVANLDMADLSASLDEKNESVSLINHCKRSFDKD